MSPDLQLCETATPDDIQTYADDGWLAERKLDGVRCLARSGRLLTRSGNDVTASFPEIDPPEAHTFDGELVTTNFQFESILRRVQTEQPFQVDMLAERFPARLVVFDALSVNGESVRDEPLTERHALLEPSVPTDAGIITATAHADPVALWETARNDGWEGIILKDPNAPYRGERSAGWLKVKDWNEATFPVVRTETTDNGGFVVLIDIGTDELQKVVVNGQDDQRELQNGVDAVEVQYLERSPDDRLRKPSFKGVA